MLECYLTNGRKIYIAIDKIEAIEEYNDHETLIYMGDMNQFTVKGSLKEIIADIKAKGV